MPIYEWQPRSAEIGISPAFAVFPVHNLQAAMDFYRRLGFEVHQLDVVSAHAAREGLHIQLRRETAELDPLSSRAEVYVETIGVDELHAEWKALDLMPIETIVTPDIRAELRRRRATGDCIGVISAHVIDQLSGARDFGLHDPDNNRLRFGRRAEAGHGIVAA